MKGNNHYMWKGFAGVLRCLSLFACCERDRELCLFFFFFFFKGLTLSTFHCLVCWRLFFKFNLVNKRQKKEEEEEEICHSIPLRYRYVIFGVHFNTFLLYKNVFLLKKKKKNLVEIFCELWWESYIFIFVRPCVSGCSASLPLPLLQLQLPARECGYFALLLLLAVVSSCIRWCEWISHSFSWMCFLKVLFNIWCNYNRH